MLTRVADTRAEARASSEQLEELESRSCMWVLDTRSAIRKEMQFLLSQVDRAHVDVQRIGAELVASRDQCEALLANKNALCHAMQRMVPGADLKAEQAARAELAAEKDRLVVRGGKMQEEIDSMTVRLQAAQSEVDRLLKILQVALMAEAFAVPFNDDCLSASLEERLTLQVCFSGECASG